MYSFCFTLPYGSILIIGGIIGYMKGSAVSLVMGCGLGLLVMGLANKTMAAHKAGKGYQHYEIGNLLVTLVVTGAMYNRYNKTGAMMPSGGVCILSAAMAAFLAYRLACPLPAKKTQELKN